MSLLKRKKIIQLPKNVADKIAAGEVVDRPVSIVKELVENSIDAGANSIVIEIKNGGKSYIRVTDNGQGISSEDVETAFLRHATSKIQTDEDLYKINTLGFRGEALASIAAVTRTELITKTSEEDTGTKIKIEGGIVVEKVKTGAPEGTTIIVTDLFYNTPARLKFLKKDNTESAQIIDFISKLALAYPEIKIRMINNEKILFSTSGKGDIFENIVVIYGKEIGENLIGFQEDIGGGMVLHAYISNPVYHKTSRRSQFFFVNGRYISDKILEQAITEGYGDKMMDGRYPVAFLFLTVPTDSVDVNIHPNKKEIRFHDGKSLKMAVSKAIFDNLDQRLAIPETKPENVFKRVLTKDESGEKIAQLEISESRVDEGRSAELFASQRKEIVPEIPKQFADEIGESRTNYKVKPFFESKTVEIKSSEKEKKEPPFLKEKKEETKFTYHEKEVIEKKSDMDILKKNDEEKLPLKEEIPTSKQDMKQEPSSPPFPESQKHDFHFENLIIMGTVFNTYIAATDREYFYLIDQHAAHERVFYEQFLHEFYSQENYPQMLMEPFMVDVSFAQKEESPGWMEFLISAGFLIEPFGSKSYLIKGIPSFMDFVEAKAFVTDFMDSVNPDNEYKDRKIVEKIILRSCKSAVKANDVLHEEEVSRLIQDLSKTSNPYSCPHGRPVIVKLGKYELEKMFKRRV